MRSPDHYSTSSSSKCSYVSTRTRGCLRQILTKKSDVTGLFVLQYRLIGNALTNWIEPGRCAVTKRRVWPSRSAVDDQVCRLLVAKAVINRSSEPCSHQLARRDEGPEPACQVAPGERRFQYDPGPRTGTIGTGIPHGASMAFHSLANQGARAKRVRDRGRAFTYCDFDDLQQASRRG